MGQSQIENAVVSTFFITLTEFTMQSALVSHTVFHEDIDMGKTINAFYATF